MNRLEKYIFSLFIASFIVSQVGNSFRSLALELWIFDALDQSTTARTIVLLTATVPGLLLGATAGAVSDRFNKINILIYSNWIRVVISVLLAVAFYLDLPKVGMGLNLLGTVVGLFFASSSFAILPAIVKKANLKQANSVLEASFWSAAAITPAIASFSYVKFGGQVSFALDAVSFAVSALILTQIKRRYLSSDDRKTPVAATPSTEKKSSLTRDILDAVKYLKSTKSAIYLLIGSYGVAISSTAISFSLIYIVLDDMKMPLSLYGILFSWNSILAIASSVFMVVLSKKLSTMSVFSTCLILMAISTILIGFSWNWVVLAIAIALSGLANAPYNIAVSTLFQEEIELSYLGRVEGFDTAVENALKIGVTILSGIGIAAFSPRITLLTFGTIGLLFALVGVVGLKKNLRPTTT